MEATTACILDKRRMLKKSKSYRLAIRVTYDRKPMSFPINFALSEVNFKKLTSPNLGKELSLIRDAVKKEIQKATDIIKSLGTFTFVAFCNEFYKEKNYKKKTRKNLKKTEAELLSSGIPNKLVACAEGKNRKYGRRKYNRIRSEVNYNAWGPLAVAFGEYITCLEQQERIGTLELYFSTLISLLKFNPELRFEDITVVFLYQYEQWMVAKGVTYTTIGMHTRNLRAIINIQIQDGLLPQSFYPFGKRKYRVTTGTNIKKALNLFEIKKLYDYVPNPDNKNEALAKDIWFVGYFCNGMNVKDIACLKYRNIHEDFIIINREKTKNTTRANPKSIVIPMNEDIIATINRWGNANKEPNNFIFPILIDGVSAYRQRELVQDFTAIVNNWMKKLQKVLA
jgi:integrase/recombinase XerD